MNVSPQQATNSLDLPSKGPSITRSRSEEHLGSSSIRHTILRNAMLAMFGLPESGADAMSARLKALLGGGIRRQNDARPGRGKAHHTNLAEALAVALALHLQRAFAPPSAVIDMILLQDDLLASEWRKAAAGQPSTILFSVDAFGNMGIPAKRTGRFAESAAGTIHISSGRKNCMADRGTMAPPMIRVDMRAFYHLVTAHLLDAGMASHHLRGFECIPKE